VTTVAEAAFQDRQIVHAGGWSKLAKQRSRTVDQTQAGIGVVGWCRGRPAGSGGWAWRLTIREVPGRRAGVVRQKMMYELPTVKAAGVARHRLALCCDAV
jgi:hypothetical protein